MSIPFWVYMLRCSDGSFYTGHTDNLESRLHQHASGAIDTCYTFRRRPVVLVHAQAFPSREEALSAERRIKGWSRAKKIALQANDWKEINRLTRGKHRRQRGVPG
ncbi:MAG: GIY-YIG nuclease family protein [Luteimonas sp.]|nr:GIY-YIG nuclease family protein [Luteimonas sp.]